MRQGAGDWLKITVSMKIPVYDGLYMNSHDKDTQNIVLQPVFLVKTRELFYDSVHGTGETPHMKGVGMFVGNFELDP